MNKYYVSDLINALDLKVEVSVEKISDKLIEIGEINRLGLELTGFFQHNEPKRVLIIGNKENAYINQMKYDDIINCFDSLFVKETPCLIVTRDNVVHELIIEMAHKREVPILRWPNSTSSLMLRLFALFDEWFAKKSLISGTLLHVNGKGVLIKGPSGIGKSEIALELIRRGHNLVSDDAVEVAMFDNSIIGNAPKLIKNMIEIRGLGILDVSQLFGYSIISEQAKVDYVIQLEKWDNYQSFERVGDHNLYEEILGIKIKKLILPVSEGRNMAEVIEVAITNFKLLEKGINTSADFATMHENELKEKNNVK